MSWHTDTDGLVYDESGNTLGDDQVGGEWSVRLVRDDRPLAFIQVTSAVVRNNAGRFNPLAKVMYLIGTDPADLPGTQEWSETGLDDTHELDYETAEVARIHAIQMGCDWAEYVAPYLSWDGVTHEYPRG